MDGSAQSWTNLLASKLMIKIQILIVSHSHLQETLIQCFNPLILGTKQITTLKAMEEVDA